MTDKPKKLSDIAHALLTRATTRDDHLIRPPQSPTAATRQVARSLLSAGLAEELPTAIDDAGYAWHIGEQGSLIILRATALGIARITDGDTASASPTAIVDGTQTSAAATDAGLKDAALAITPSTTPADAVREGQKAAERGEIPPAVTSAAEPTEATSASASE